MKMRHITILSASLALAACAPTTGGTDAGGGEGEGEGEFPAFRTLLYRELTTGDTPIIARSVSISDDGAQIAYATRAAPQNTIWIAATDGSAAPIQIDQYDALCGCDSRTVTDPAGVVVASTDNVQIRVVDGLGNLGLLGGIVMNDGWITDMAFDDSSQLYFTMYRDTAWSGGPVERGIYRLNLTTGEPEQLVGPAQAASVLGTTIDKVQFFSLAGPTLGVSADGAKMIFGVPVNDVGNYLMRYTVASDLAEILVGPVGPTETAGPGIRHASLSDDGTTVVYEAGNNPGAVDPSEFVAIGWNGLNERLVTAVPPSPGVSNFSFMPLTHDGAQVLLGDVGHLYDTDDGAVLELPVRGGFFSNDATPISLGGTFTMATSGRQFAYTQYDAANVVQLASLVIEPPDWDDNPSLTSAMLEKTTIDNDGVDATRVRVSVSGAGGVTRVSTAMLKDGRRDTAQNCLAAEVVLYDDGQNGDAAAGDFQWTSPPITATDCTPVGEWTVRVKAEAVVGGKRRASAIDFATLTVE